MQVLDLLHLPLTGSALIEASAGTGKTYTIAALYLRAVLGHGGQQPGQPQAPLLPPQILVVTFTEAATGELIERIRQRLTGAAAFFRGDVAQADPVLQQLAADYDQSQWPHCALRLELAAQWMDEAAISTIHGWCNRMLTEHAFASGSRFEEELSTDQSALLLEVAEDYWRTFVYAFTPAALLRWQRSFREPADLLLAFRGIWQEPPLPVSASPLQLIEHEQQQRQQQLAELKAPWPQWVAELIPLFAKAREEKRLHGTKLRADYLQKWLQGILDFATDANADQLDIGAGSSRLTPEGIADACKGEPLQHPAFAAMAALIPALAALPDCSEDLRQHALHWCQQRFADSQRQRGVFGFDDMLARLLKALQSEQGEQLQSAIRQQFPLALIDEFQDTDPVQFGIFSAIYQLQHNRTDCGILLIGDPKQAIYAFRGADIYTYLQAKQQTAPRHYSLDTNFRSSTAMVAAVNLLFSRAEERDTGLGAFLFRQQQDLVNFSQVKAKGRTEQLVHQGQALPALELVLLDGDKHFSKAAYFQQLAEHCAATIAGLLNQGQAGQTGFLTETTSFRPLLPQHIAVLVNNQQEAGLIRSALQQQGVRSVYLSDRGSVFNTAIARDLLLWLEACADPLNELKVRSALASQSLGWRYQQLARLQQDEWFFEHWLHCFVNFGRLWQQQGVLPLVRQLLSDFDLVSRFGMLADGERQLTDLLHLAELLQQLSRTLEGEQALLRYFKEHLAGEQQLDAEMLKLRLESDEALVRVVTIHKSKGLEYPLVFLPFIAAAKPLDPTRLPYRYHDASQQLQLCYEADESIFAKADLERLGEDLRKLYVALTRAQHYCYLGLAPLKEQSAVSYLLCPAGRFEPGSLATELGSLQQPALRLSSCQQLLLAEAATEAVTEQDSAPGPDRLVAASLTPGQQYRQMPQRPRLLWWAASYSALAEGAGQPVAGRLAGVRQPDDEDLADVAGMQKNTELQQELAAERVASDDVVNVDPDPSQLYVRGAKAGTFLHDCLQWAAEQGFAVVAQQPELMRQHLIEQAMTVNWLWQDPAGGQWHRRLLVTDERQLPVFPSAQQAVEPLWQWFCQLLQQRWPCGEGRLALAELTDYQAELEFWFAASAVDTKALDKVLHQWLWPQLPRPALKPRLVNGMLKGFIDLSFCWQGRYYVADYKSNFIEDGRYDETQLVQLMLEKRYDLQAALYGLALHRLLKNRLAGYEMSRHLGQACYWFVRGCTVKDAGVPDGVGPDGGQQQHGMLQFSLPPALILALDALFAGQPAQEVLC